MIEVTSENAKIGLRVIRGKDWQWGNQDKDEKGKKTIGTITHLNYNSHHPDMLWVSVEWDSGNSNGYRVGPEYDLYIYKKNVQLEFDF